MVSQILLMALLLLLAQGWGITTPLLRDKKMFVTAVSAYGLIYHVVFIYQLAAQDPGSTLNLFQVRGEWQYFVPFWCFCVPFHAWFG